MNIFNGFIDFLLTILLIGIAWSTLVALTTFLVLEILKMKGLL